MILTRKIALLLACVFAASTWLYISKILVPAEKVTAAIRGTPRGNLSDLYPRWFGSRELLLHHRDPYSQEITREIQIGYYGRPISAKNPNDPIDQQGFAYPAYSVFFLAPTIHSSFPAVQQGYKWLLMMLTAISVVLWKEFLGWKPVNTALFIAVILVLGSLAVVQGIKLQQLSLLVAFLLSWCFISVLRGRFILAGFLLAAATIKPQLACLPIILLIVWAIRDWKKRQNLAWAFIGAMVLLCVGAQLILPGWMKEFWNALLAYQQYTHATPLLGWIFTPMIGNILSIFLFVLGIIVCWPLLHRSAQPALFPLATAFMLTLTVVVVPMVAPYNQILLAPAVFVLVKDAPILWRGGIMRILFAIVVLALIWPWVVSLGLIVVYEFSPIMARNHWHLPFATTFIFPLVLFALVVIHVLRSSSENKKLRSQLVS